MQLISELDKFGEFFIGPQTSNIWNNQINKVDKIIINNNKTEAILISGKEKWKESDNSEKDYYGSVKVYFSILKQTPPLKKENLKKMKLITDLGKLSKVTILQIMMMFISVNFVNKLNYLSILLNDLYLDIKSDKKNGIIYAYNKSKYYTGSINITFS